MRIGEHRRCDLAEIAGDAAAEAAPLMGDRELSVDNDHPLRVEGSPDELHRMVLNLLDNAARHTPPGARSSCACAQRGATAVLEVADDGPGIPARVREQIFDRFVRGEGPADIASGPGTGLGLAIVSARSRAPTGARWRRPIGAGGALFRVRLPLVKSEPVISRPLEAL